MVDNAASEKDLQRLQHMETRLIEAGLARPELTESRQYSQLRYLLNFARLDRFQPGAAAGRPRGGDVQVSPELVSPLRERVLEALYGPLHDERNAWQRFTKASANFRDLDEALAGRRQALLQHHVDDFSEEELDAEVGRKSLVCIAGGGGGAGYVYIGAWARMQEAGLVPDYVVGASIGALLGSFRSRRRSVDFREELEWAKSLQGYEIFSRPGAPIGHSLPGLMRLHLEAVRRRLTVDGEELRMADLEIPFDVVIGGVKRKVYERLPWLLKAPEAVRESDRRFSYRLGARMWQLTTLITVNVIKELVLGQDAETAQWPVTDAIGFSAAIPAVLQYLPKRLDPAQEARIEALKQSHGLAALVDGGVANNVPAKTAWRSVRAGRIGTRNAYYLAFDCFHPQMDRHHLWLWPVTQAVRLQMPANQPYMDSLVRFEPTLSPVNLLPRPEQLNQAWQWGWDQIGGSLPLLEAMLAPVQWSPPRPEG